MRSTIVMWWTSGWNQYKNITPSPNATRLQSGALVMNRPVADLPETLWLNYPWSFQNNGLHGNAIWQCWSGNAFTKYAEDISLIHYFASALCSSFLKSPSTDQVCKSELETFHEIWSFFLLALDMQIFAQKSVWPACCWLTQPASPPSAALFNLRQALKPF